MTFDRKEEEQDYQNRTAPYIRILNELSDAWNPKLRNMQSFTPFFIAGGAVARDGKPNDVDVFFTHALHPLLCAVQNPTFSQKGWTKLAETPHALTFNYVPEKGEPLVFQFCRKHAPNLQALVDSFDFSHMQVGVSSAGQVYRTQAYLDSDVGKCEYTGTMYPFNSLLRVTKYEARGDFTKKQGNALRLQILADIVKRGFHDFEDFQSQICSVDLSLLSDREALDELYQNLYKNKEKPSERLSFTKQENPSGPVSGV